MLRLAALSLAALALLASPALAASKNDGPHAPFPEGDPVQRALDFVRKLNAERLPPAARRQAARVGTRHLRAGASLPDPGTTPPDEKAVPKAASSPSRRAGISGRDDHPGRAALPFALVAAALAAAAIGFELHARRRPLRA
jgi:hypothetical protein